MSDLWIYTIWLNDFITVLSYRYYHINVAITFFLLLVLALRKPASKSIPLLNSLWILPLAAFFCYNLTLIDRVLPRLSILLRNLLMRQPLASDWVLDLSFLLAEIEYYSVFVFMTGTVVTAILIRLGTRKLRKIMKHSEACAEE